MVTRQTSNLDNRVQVPTKAPSLVEHVRIMHLTLTQGMRFDSDAGYAQKEDIMFGLGMLIGVSMTAGWLLRAVLKANEDARHWFRHSLPLWPKG